MQALKEQLFEKVNASLQSATAPDEPASSAAGRVASDALAGRWRSVLDRCALQSCSIGQVIVSVLHKRCCKLMVS